MSKLRRTLATVAGPLLAAGTAGPALAATTAPQTPQQPGQPQVPAVAKYDSWQNQWSAKYLHVKGSSKANSAIVNVYTDDGSCADHGSANLGCDEEWQQISTGYAHQFAYKNVNSGKCLDDPEDLTGQTAVQYSCTTYPVQRRWFHGGNSPGGGPLNLLYDSALTATTNGVREDAFLCQNRPAGSTNTLLTSYYEAESYYTFAACSWQ